MMGRTGTKYLIHLFRLHPDCAGRYSVSEEGLLCRLQHLAAYTHVLHAAWSICDPTREEPAHLSRCVGDGVVQYMV
jgi:hypothetical protein